MTETSIAFLGTKNSQNAVFVGSRFLALGEGSLEKTFSNAKSIHFYTRKRLKKTHILTEEDWTIILIPICLILASILFQFILLYFCWSFRVEVQIKLHARVAFFEFFEFSRIIAFKIFIDLVLLWCKTFLFLFLRSWLFLLLLPITPKIFSEFFPRS